MPTEQEFETTRKRVRARLAALDRLYGANNEFANILGLHRSTVANALSGFRKTERSLGILNQIDKVIDETHGKDAGYFKAA